MKSPTLLLLALASVLAALAPHPSDCHQKQDAPAQRHTGQVPEEVGEDDVVRIDTDLILLDATVTNAAGEPVLGLRPEDFKLYEDGEERPIAFFKVEKKSDPTRPLAVVFALDTSGSMTPGEMERLRGAVRAFISRLSERPTVYAVMSFGMDAKVLQPLTNDARKLEGVFDRLVREPAGLSTHAYDAVDDAVRLLVRKAPPTRERRLLKRAVVVISDGFPVGDTVHPSTVIERANRAGVSVYTVTLPSFSRVSVPADRPPLPTPLDVSGLVDRTGGTNVYATGGSYEPLFRALAEDVTTSYLLAFYPSEEKRRDGRTHSIRVEGPPGMTVRQSRPDYTGGRQ
jgi:Ca-activated chloride channel homolog